MDERRGDDTLLSAWRDGEAEAARALIERYSDDLLRFFRGKVGVDAEDLIQQTLLGCLEAIERRASMATFRAYLFGIARNRLIDHFRRQGRNDDEFDPTQRSLADLAASPSAVVAARNDQRLLADALRRIPLDLQILLELHYWEQMSSAEVSGVLGIPAGTVRGRIGRARELLRDQMERAGASPEVLRRTAESLETWARSVQRRTAEHEDPR
ncbi:MAG: sigma-70 family RNA polymerase sigma factor [Myxococcota bacterium]